MISSNCQDGVYDLCVPIIILPLLLYPTWRLRIMIRILESVILICNLELWKVAIDKQWYRKDVIFWWINSVFWYKRFLFDMCIRVGRRWYLKKLPIYVRLILQCVNNNKKHENTCIVCMFVCLWLFYRRHRLT